MLWKVIVECCWKVVCGQEIPLFSYLPPYPIPHLFLSLSFPSFLPPRPPKRELELSQCHTEIVKIRRCVNDKKEEVKAKEQEIARLQAELDHLRQAAIGRAQPMVCLNY